MIAECLAGLEQRVRAQRKSHAEEIALRQPTMVVVAGGDDDVLQELQLTLQTERRVYRIRTCSRLAARRAGRT